MPDQKTNFTAIHFLAAYTINDSRAFLRADKNDLTDRDTSSSEVTHEQTLILITWVPSH